MTEQSIIERAARAIVKRNWPSLTELEIDDMWQDHAADARVVLIAIREPDKAMIEAALPHCSANWRDSECREFLPDIWKAMIDAAK